MQMLKCACVYISFICDYYSHALYAVMYLSVFVWHLHKYISFIQPQDGDKQLPYWVQTICIKGKYCASINKDENIYKESQLCCLAVLLLMLTFTYADTSHIQPFVKVYPPYIYWFQTIIVLNP